MIFYGRRSSIIKDGQLSNISCSHCEAITSMSYAIYGKYAHLYWIPTFPMGREAIFECNNCKKTFSLPDLPEATKKKYEFEKQGVRTPVWYFSGIMVIAAIIAILGYSISKDKELSALYAKSPEVGDVYSIQLERNGFYSTAKVTHVINDSVFLVYNDYEIDKRSQVRKIDLTKNYTTAIDSFTTQEITQLFEDEIIYDVDRD